MAHEFEHLAYESSLRSLDKQDEVFSELRARTGLVLAASALAASFLGDTALDNGPLLLTVLALVRLRQFRWGEHLRAPAQAGALAAEVIFLLLAVGGTLD